MRIWGYSVYYFNIVESWEKRSETFWLRWKCSSLQTLRFLNLSKDGTSPFWLRFPFKHLASQQLLTPAASSPTDPVASKWSIPDGSGSPPSGPPVTSVIPSWIQSICQPIDQPGHPRRWGEVDGERERGKKEKGLNTQLNRNHLTCVPSCCHRNVRYKDFLLCENNAQPKPATRWKKPPGSQVLHSESKRDRIRNTRHIPEWASGLSD